MCEPECEILFERLCEVEGSVGIPKSNVATTHSLYQDLADADAKLHRLLPFDTKLVRRLGHLRILSAHANYHDDTTSVSTKANNYPSLPAKKAFVASRESQIKDAATMLEEIKILMTFCSPPDLNVYRKHSDHLQTICIKDDALKTKVQAQARELERLLVKYNATIDAINSKFLELKVRLDLQQNQTNAR